MRAACLLGFLLNLIFFKCIWVFCLPHLSVHHKPALETRRGPRIIRKIKNHAWWKYLLGPGRGGAHLKISTPRGRGRRISTCSRPAWPKREFQGSQRNPASKPKQTISLFPSVIPHCIASQCLFCWALNCW